MLASPTGAEYHDCWGFAAAQIVHIRRCDAAGYSPVYSVRGAASNSPVNSGRDVPLVYTAKPFVTRAVSLEVL